MIRNGTLSCKPACLKTRGCRTLRPDPRTLSLLMAMGGGDMAMDLAGDMDETKEIKKRERDFFVGCTA